MGLILNWNKTYLNISSVISCTEVEGPGKRFSLWVQGCLKRCAGCCNPNELEIERNQIVSTKDIMNEINKAVKENNIEGITLLGGEPILQAEGLLWLAIQSKNIGLSIILFTGYTFDELERENFPYYSELLAHCDIIIEGPFIQTKPDNKRNWVGSTNQVIHYNTEFYQAGIEYDREYIDGIEMRFKNDELLISGFPYAVKT